MVLKIRNKAARHLWLDAQHLCASPTGPLDLSSIIQKLGYVQLDTIQNVVRAHHHILWSRNQRYRAPMLDALLAEERAIFEHFTHDASVIPMDFYPMWQRQFTRLEKQIRSSKSFSTMMAPKERNKIRQRIEREGPLSTKDFNTKIEGKKVMWARPPHKRALDFMWYAGVLTTCHREKFQKFYDLTERVIPEHILTIRKTDQEQLDWLCHAALDRLGFASESDIQRFWDAASLPEVKSWTAMNAKHLTPIELECADGTWQQMLAPKDIDQRLAQSPTPSTRLRLLNPFDPTIRDRGRLKRLFGFDYKIEIFIPPAKRQWGYYVYPLLEKDRFVGRIELKADRKNSTLQVVNFWQEPNVAWRPARLAKLQAELDRFRRFAALEQIVWLCQAG